MLALRIAKAIAVLQERNLFSCLLIPSLRAALLLADAKSCRYHRAVEAYSDFRCVAVDYPEFDFLCHFLLLLRAYALFVF